jgi:hypothetical protein
MSETTTVSPEFAAFVASEDTLRVYRDGKLVFSSRKDRLAPLVEYIDRFGTGGGKVVVFDKIAGNAAALLSVKAGAIEVHSPLGSELAIKTFERFGIKCHLIRTVPYIERADGQGMCPMEKLSLGKEPEDFYRLVRQSMTK